MSDKEVLKFLESVDADIRVQKGYRGNNHLTIISDNSIKMGRLQRVSGEVLCGRVFRKGMDDSDTKDSICPLCLSIARRMMAARYVVDGKLLRFLEERHV